MDDINGFHYNIGSYKCYHIEKTGKYSNHTAALMSLLAFNCDIASYGRKYNLKDYRDDIGIVEHAILFPIFHNCDTISNIEFTYDKTKKLTFSLVKYIDNNYNISYTVESQYNMTNYWLSDHIVINVPQEYDIQDIIDSMSISYIHYVYDIKHLNMLKKLPDRLNMLNFGMNKHNYDKRQTYLMDDLLD